MRRFRLPWSPFLATILPALTLAGDYTSVEGWPQFRGPRAAGVAGSQSPPVFWNAEAGANVRWKTAIPGLGHASPVVARDRVFVLTAVSSDFAPGLRVGLYGDIAPVQDEPSHTWRLLCLSMRTGQILWERTLHEGLPKIKRHTKATHANSTPATDGVHLVVFLGSEGLYCYDLCGRLLWKKDLGVLDSGYYKVPDAQWGFGSSPIIHNKMVFIQCDVQNGSYLAAFDVRNGRELWRAARGDLPTWSTPTIHEGDNRTELIVNGYKHAGAYDPLTGKELWRLGGGGDIPVPTPVVAHGLIILSSAHGGRAPLCAVRLGANGDITPTDDSQLNEHIAWYKRRDGIYIQTPIAYGNYLYACKNNGLLSCYDIRTGELQYRERLGSGRAGFTASPVAAGGKLYFIGEEGDIYVVRSGPRFELLATNSMGEVCMATPAISDDMLIVRARDHVYGVGAPSSRSTILADDPCAPTGRRCLGRVPYRQGPLSRIRTVLGNGLRR